MKKKTPLFYIFKAYSNNCLGSAVDTYVECGTFNTPNFSNIPYLDVTATYSKDNNTVFVNVVNRDKDKALTTDISNISGGFEGSAEASLIAGQELQEAFVFDKQEQYVPVKKEVQLKNHQLSYTFPPHSFTQIKITVGKK